MQGLLDAAPQADRYFSDAYAPYGSLIYYPGRHQLMWDKSQTYSVEADNAELRHYLARLARKSRCFSRCIDALRATVRLFIFCWNQRQLHKQRYPAYPTHLIDFVTPAC
jgi:insertion element IS1 protein InsB